MDDVRRTHRRRRRGLLALLMAATALISATGATLSLAYFTDSTALGGNTFTTGTIKLGVTPTAPSVIFTASKMMPGDVVPASGGSPVVVTNLGTATFRYDVVGTSTDADVPTPLHLNTQLVITVRQVGSGCAAFDGAIVFSGPVPTAGVTMYGELGAIAGEVTLAQGASQTLCFQASLPFGTGNGYQGATSTYTFTFNAEQTANNP
jgi:predicted ribosomally synthesized peptide with SipW-like signal peptide